jgi:hypothetical protein
MYTQDDGTDATVVPGSEMVVSRTAYDDNTSKYQVDGKKKTRGEVEVLLASKGIDLENNRFLILQVHADPPALTPPPGIDWLTGPAAATADDDDDDTVVAAVAATASAATVTAAATARVRLSRLPR